MSIERDITNMAKKALAGDDILLFVGARQAGKTTILRQLEAHVAGQQQPTYFLNLEDPDYLALLNASPKNLFQIFTVDLARKNFVFIDEVQYLEQPAHFLKYFFDEYRGKIQIIASGSSAFYLDEKFTDSLAGRKKLFSVHTLSFREFLRFKETAGLAERMGAQLGIKDREQLVRLGGEYLVYGGYPRIVLAPLEEKVELLRDLAYSYVKKDIFEARVRNEELFYHTFKLIARQVGNLVNASEIASTLGMSKTAVEHYLAVMQKSFHIRLVRPFARNIRTELSKMPKAYFLDIGLRNFFADNFQSFATRDDRGPLLENAVLRQLIEHDDDMHIHFWRTTGGQEVDFVVDERQAFEAKANPAQFSESSCRLFLETYPDIPLSIVTFGAQTGQTGSYAVRDFWDV